MQRRKYRFRILNGSVSRAYEYALPTGDPFTVIATDGGLMPYPQTVTRMRHVMAERYEVVIDFARYRPGTRIVLVHCHNLVHEDHDMMSQVEVVGPTAPGEDPLGRRARNGSLEPDDPL